MSRVETNSQGEHMEKLGNKNVTLAIVLIASLANASDAFGHETGWKDRAAELLGIIPLIKDANAIDFKQVLPELKDLSADERAEMLKAFGEKFAIQDHQLEDTIEKGLDAVMDLVASAGKVYDFVKALKGDSSAPQVADAEVDETGAMKAGANQAALATPKKV